MVQIWLSVLARLAKAILSPLGEKSGPLLRLLCVSMAGNPTTVVGTAKMSGAGERPT